MILNCKQAQELVNADATEGPSQGLVDFVNDLGGRIGGDRVWVQAQEPPSAMRFTVLQPVLLYFVAQRDLDCYCRETVEHGRAMVLLRLDAGVGNLTIRAQLYAISKRDPSQVEALRT